MTPDEWKKAESVVPVLAKLEHVTTVMSGSKYPTVSLVIPVLNELKQSLWRLVVDGSLQPEATELCHALVNGIDQRWPNYERSQLYAPATLLDPRYKDCAFLDTDAATSAQNCVVEMAIKLMADESTNVTDATISHTSQGVPAGGSSTDCSWEWLRKKAEQKSQTARLAPKGTVVRTELCSFLAEPLLSSSSSGNAASSSQQTVESCTSSLQWWSEHKRKYPSLAPVVRMLFAIPATSVPSERLFSKAGLVITDRRSRLSPQHAEEQCFMSCNWVD
jgi:hypothetical protein